VCISKPWYNGVTEKPRVSRIENIFTPFCKMKFILYFFALPFYILKIVVMFAIGVLLLLIMMLPLLFGGISADELSEHMREWGNVMFTYPGNY
jgi:hypothetical protein